MIDITYPVTSEKTAVYNVITDAEKRMIMFTTISPNMDATASFIAQAINEKLNLNRSKDSGLQDD
jgi:hypothetical protein